MIELNYPAIVVATVAVFVVPLSSRADPPGRCEPARGSPQA